VIELTGLRVALQRLRDVAQLKTDMQMGLVEESDQSHRQFVKGAMKNGIPVTQYHL